MNLDVIKETKLYIKVIAICCFIVLSVSLVLALKPSGNTVVGKLSPAAAIANLSPRTMTACNGNSWQEISKFNASENEKLQMKSMLLKISIESSLLSGNPIISSNASFPAYIKYIDMFYSNPQNLELPLFFALKMADMAKNGADDKNIQIYKVAITQKLKTVGLMQ